RTPILVDPLLAVRTEPRLWSPPEDRRTDGTVDDGVVTLSAGDMPEVWPHSIITVEFAKSMTEEGPSFSGYETLLPQSLGSVSRNSATYVLRELTLTCESDAAATPAQLGTWVKSPASRPDPKTGKRLEPRPPNTCLQLLTSDRFGRRGSIS